MSLTNLLAYVSQSVHSVDEAVTVLQERAEDPEISSNAPVASGTYLLFTTFADQFFHVLSDFRGMVKDLARDARECNRQVSVMPLNGYHLRAQSKPDREGHFSDNAYAQVSDQVVVRYGSDDFHFGMTIGINSARCYSFASLKGVSFFRDFISRRVTKEHLYEKFFDISVHREDVAKVFNELL